MTSHAITRRAEGEKLSARFLFAVCASLVLLIACAKTPVVTYSNGVVTAVGWNGGEPKDGWASVLSVRAGEAPDSPAVLGDYTFDGGLLKFTPRFPPEPGVKLYVTFNPPRGGQMHGAYGEPAVAVTPSTKVTQIYPTTDEWPANALKMYVEFSAPMAANEAYEHVRLLDEKGEVIIEPFVQIDQELWSADNTRMTFLFDPGRIKRGLVDNANSGPPLMPGRSVTIEIDAGWRDARGAPLVEAFRRTIKVSEALRKPVDMKAWIFDLPKQSGDPLVIHFDRPLDHALAQRAITVTRDGSPVAGEKTLAEKEAQLRFAPDAPWTEGDYAIVVNGVIEDLAGNRLGKVFDVDTKDPTQSTSASETAIVAFEFPAP